MRFTVAAPGTMVRFYQQALGIPLRAGDFMSLGDWAALLGQSTAQWAVTEAQSAGPVREAEGINEVQFVAFRRVNRHTFSGRPQDPGTPGLSLRIANLSAALRAIRSAGLRVLCAGGQPVALPGGGAAVLFRDPAGVLVELLQR
jgi:catechol 2,3-dioxygenase-like lactoylglutathione lyase family enzyme